MRLFFRPFPGLTVFTAICLAILISLGTWQYHRLQWKTALLEEIEEAATSEPLFGVDTVQDLLDAGKPVDFRRISLNIKPLSQQPAFFVYESRTGGTFWRPYIPVRTGNMSVFVAWHPIISDAEKASAIISPATETNITGYVRLARAQGRLATKSTPNKNRWFGFNPMPDTDDWADSVAGPIETRFYIDHVGTNLSTNDIPPKRPDIRNNHLDYMLTWYSFALILLVIYFMLHYRRGRFGLKPSPH